MNVEYIVISPEKVLAAYQAGVDGLTANWDTCLAKAEQADAEYEEETAKLVAEGEATKAKEKALHKQALAKFEADTLAWDAWQATPFLLKLFVSEPEHPSFPMLWGAWLHTSFSVRMLRWGRARRAAALKTAMIEAQSMLKAAEAEPKEFHFTQAQFKRMQDWGSGAVLAGFMPKDTKAEVEHG